MDRSGKAATEVKMLSPLFSCAIFRSTGVCGSSSPQALLVSHRSGIPAERTQGMKINVWYEKNRNTVYEISTEEAENLWVSLGLEEEEDLTQEEKEERIQEEFDRQFNRPDRNNWRNHNRKRKFEPKPRAKKLDGKAGYVDRDPDDPSFDVMDHLCVTFEEEEIMDRLEYEEVCAWIREELSKKPEWAEAFISVYLDGESIRDYAARTGNDENNITQKLKRAKKKLKEAWLNRQIKGLPGANR